MKARQHVRAIAVALALVTGTVALAGLEVADRAGGSATTVQANTSWGWPVCVGKKLPLDACSHSHPAPTPHTVVKPAGAQV
ncbi:hypothetical protein P3T36_005209 [Kitasatospora sp. MAP12-15]|uniref:hypothetical protein n=1 Tax=unclassified Kitasatospora TaxID=2633591 RepID=UPI00247638F3|nr:hypothetical protein [Kitasatospora sp. MAP12-44]MDH6113628.1 hypothetical protein [Kitasatospora sp. MAP12-44]